MSKFKKITHAKCGHRLSSVLVFTEFSVGMHNINWSAFLFKIYCYAPEFINPPNREAAWVLK